MSALGRFIGRDAAARVVLLAALASPLAAPVAAGAGPLATAVPSVASPVAMANTLVTLSDGGDKLSKVVDALRQGTRRCLVAQGRLMNELGNHGFDLSEDDPVSETKVSWNRASGLKAAGLRSDALAKDISGENTLMEARKLLADGSVTGQERDVLLHHRNLRAACLSWTARSLDMLYANLGEAPGEGMADRLTQIREMAAHDTVRMASLAKGEIPLDSAAIEAMESFGPGR